MFVHADPYPWPFDGDLRPANTALVIIDVQEDFVSPAGAAGRWGVDLAALEPPLQKIEALIADLLALLRSTWSLRGDRYSEEREALRSGTAQPKKIEMYYIGG